MPDREKVIRELKAARLFFEIGSNRADGVVGNLGCKSGMKYIDDALELLKEQEEVEPKQVELYGKDEWWGLVCVCPVCKAEWMSDKADTHFCPKCGEKVMWDD